VKPGLAIFAVASILAVSLGPNVPAQQQPAAVPDAPAPQPAPPLAGASGVTGPITPGSGSGEEAITGTSSSTTTQQAPTSPATSAPDNFQNSPPLLPAPGEGLEAMRPLQVNVNFVVVPVTVKDPKGKQVPGLTWRDFKIFENGQREQIRLFTADAAPLSMAFVIDQSLTSDVMSKVNNSLGSIQGALTPYDEIAVFSYSNGSQERTGFTGAQSARVPAVLALTKETGTEEVVPVNSGPLAGCNVRENGACVDPNLQPGRSAGSGSFITIPKEIHTLNDAIMAAAKELSNRPKERRRIIYVISDGKEYGSKSTIKEVVRFLQTNNIAVYGTLVGSSAQWGEGYLSKFHLPFTMYDNVLYKYIAATGGQADSEKNLNGIEKSYADIAMDARNQYTIVYASHESPYDSKFRKIDIRVDRPGLDVTAKSGYYPSALMSR
jgi:VWFA-related protein